MTIAKNKLRFNNKMSQKFKKQLQKYIHNERCIFNMVNINNWSKTNRTRLLRNNRKNKYNKIMNQLHKKH